MRQGWYHTRDRVCILVKAKISRNRLLFKETSFERAIDVQMITLCYTVYVRRPHHNTSKRALQAQQSPRNTQRPLASSSPHFTLAIWHMLIYPMLSTYLVLSAPYNLPHATCPLLSAPCYLLMPGRFPATPDMAGCSAIAPACGYASLPSVGFCSGWAKSLNCCRSLDSCEGGAG